jgi:DNA-binding NarL/FixJ family response regulator
MSLRVVVGEDEPFVREGIVPVLERSDFDVVGVAADAPDLLRKANAHQPDVVVTDIQMPPTSTDDGLRATIKIRATQPDVAVLVLSQFIEEDYAVALVGDRADGVGYLLKERVSDLDHFADAVRRVAAGGPVAPTHRATDSEGCVTGSKLSAGTSTSRACPARARRCELSSRPPGSRKAGGSTTRRNRVALVVAPQASHEDRSSYGERGAVTGGP